ncbi:hypothetical protein LCGC14_0369890 [marine sediment metagenome]|uniref:DNA helicase DnaB-like N-terminal domain-containing protein n=1 Tax=marine sediment metagenome TaxID=412755 RepID=A0A0F9T5H5_9ZZZZ
MYKDLSPPHSSEAELSVLGSCFIDYEAFKKVKDMLIPQDFYIDKNQWVFAVMLNLYWGGQPTNQIIVAYGLQRMGKLQEVGGAVFISHCIAETPTSVHVVYYAKLVKECSDRRNQIVKGEKQIQDAFEGKVQRGIYD